jgi:hypothetical protein
MLSLDLPGAAVKLYQVIRQDRELQDWVKLILGAFFSAFIAFTGATGASLSSGVHPAVAIGFGLLACSGSTLGVLLRDPRARSLLLSIPKPVIAAYQEEQKQVTILPVDPSKK